MKVALLHLNLSGGPMANNLATLYSAIELAAQQGVKWMITPETAVQGYFFTQKETTWQIPLQPDQSLLPIRELAIHHQLTVFLGCAEQDSVTGKYYNSCLIIGPKGQILGRHRKIRSHGVGAEGWASKGDQLQPIACEKMTAGVLVCADAWYGEHGELLRDKGAQVIIVPAAWPPGGCGGRPEEAWKRCSNVSGLPVWVCNQTGSEEKLDFSQALSTVIVKGKIKLDYSGLQQAILIFEWDCSAQCVLSKQFTVIAV